MFSMDYVRRNSMLYFVGYHEKIGFYFSSIVNSDRRIYSRVAVSKDLSSRR